MGQQPLLGTRLATLALAVSSLLVSQVTAAATIGKTNINSKQHEPLSASIEVSDIDANSFSVSVANKLLYEQMGMNPDIPVNVRFEKTSDSTGKVVLTSPEPISEPFADVVLIVNDKGRAQSLPKTLLLPLGQAKPVLNNNQTIVGATPKPKLPKVSPSDESGFETSTPVNQMANNQATGISTTNNNVVAAAPTFPNKDDFYKPDSPNNDADSNNGLSIAPTPAPSYNAATQPTQKPTPTPPVTPSAPSNVDRQTEILTTQVIRKYKTLDGEVKGSTIITDSNPSTLPIPGVPDANNDETLTAADNTSKETTNNKPTTANKAPAKPNVDIPLGKETYRVQRNDNLWTISLQIAKENNLDVYEVMEQIQAYNPDAFINGDRSRMLANVELALPAYEVIPSRLGMKAAMQARQSQNKKTSSRKNTTARTNSKTKSKTKTTSSSRSSNTTAKTKPLPKPRLTLVTPTKKGQATGTSRTGTSQGGGNGLSASLVSDLKTARTKVASEARAVSGINNELAERTRKLQLHNQKLAELEKRLKKLREQ